MDKEYIMRTEIKFIDGKYIGLVNGKAVVKSTSKYYVVRQLDGQKSDKYILSKGNWDERTNSRIAQSMQGLW